MLRTALGLTLFGLMVGACVRTDPAPTPGPPTPSNDARAVTFVTDDGVTLTGTLRGSGTVGVVMSHMFPAEDGAASWATSAARLAVEGYLALAFNFRGYVDSGGERNIAEIHRDIEAAHRLLLSEGAEQVVYVGASMGGTASLVSAARLSPAAVVTLSAPAQFRGLDAEVVARELSVPVLLMAASGDDAAAASLETLTELIPRAEAKLFDGDAHGTNLVSEATASEDEIVAFLARYAPSRPT